jgi:hypothetical protein
MDLRVKTFQPGLAFIRRREPRHRLRRSAAISVLLTLLVVPTTVAAEEWRMVIARADAVVIVDAQTVRRTGPQVSFHALIRWQKPDEDGAVGNVGDVTFDCVRKLVKTPGLQDIHVDGTTALTKDQKLVLGKTLPGSLGDLMRERMCDSKWDRTTMNGIPLDVPLELAVSAVFGLLALGLDSDQSSALAAQKYWDEVSLATQLDAASVPADRRAAVRKVLAAQTRETPPAPPPIVPLAWAVATGLVGKYIHSEHELGAGIWLRADGTFRYGLTVGSLDETAAGRWTAGNGHVQLVSDPRPVPPAITAGPVELVAGKPFSLRVIGPSGGDVPGVDFTLEFDRGDPLEGYTPGDTWHLPVAEKRIPRFVTFQMRSYGLHSARMPVDGTAGHVATFVLAPNDMGVIDMTGLIVDVDKDGLTLHREEGRMRFDKADD